MYANHHVISNILSKAYQDRNLRCPPSWDTEEGGRGEEKGDTRREQPTGHDHGKAAAESIVRKGRANKPKPNQRTIKTEERVGA